MWSVRAADENLARQLAATAGVSGQVARLLLLRGVGDAGRAREWLHPDLAGLHDPALLPDFEPAVTRLRRALREREPILVWGHDDLDGITATAVLYRLLADLRGNVSFHIPAKGRDRHGLNAETVPGEPRLVVTVDCGITNVRDVAALAGRGVDVIVTDHHEVLDELPAAKANVDPKRPDSGYPYRGLAGVGVALKLGIGLARAELGVSARELLSVRPELLTLAVLGTIADRVPLTGENRTLVAVGMPGLESSAMPAVRAVLAAVNPSRQRMTVPRFLAELLPLFASANGSEGVERFLFADEAQARQWVVELGERSREWRRDSEQSFELAEKLVQVGDGIVFVRSRELSNRALGYCAARLKDRYQVPAVVVGWRGDAWAGECRGIEGADLIELLRAHSRFFIDYGGHRRAAGFSIADGQLEEFVRSAERYAHEHFAGRIVPENVVRADAEVPLAELDPAVAALAPFGVGNPEPLFISEPLHLARSAYGWAADVRPQLRLEVAHTTQLLDGPLCRVLYSVDDRGGVTVEGCQPVAESAR